MVASRRVGIEMALRGGPFSSPPPPIQTHTQIEAPLVISKTTLEVREEEKEEEDAG